jgi:hypothetical protein
MRDIDKLYTNLLSVGLIHARELLREGCVPEASLELDHLYAIPQLMASSSGIQHRAYLEDLRPKLMNAARLMEAWKLLRHIEAHYAPIWSQLEQAVAIRFGRG